MVIMYGHWLFQNILTLDGLWTFSVWQAFFTFGTIQFVGTITNLLMEAVAGLWTLFGLYQNPAESSAIYSYLY